MRKVTMYEVARASGVSVGTVSKALSGTGQLRESTRNKVLLAARELGFRHASSGRRSAGGRLDARLVGLISHNVSDRFLMPLLLGAQRGLEQQDISVFLCEARSDLAREEHYIRLLLERNVDGLIVLGANSNPRPPLESLPHGFPLVYAYAPSTDTTAMSVVSDDVGGGRIAARRLLDLGRERIGYLSGPLGYQAAVDREKGLREVLEEHGLALSRNRVVHGEWQEQWGRSGVERLMAVAPELDGLFCGNDQLARGAADALRDQGSSVPGDIALIGFDNWDVVVEGCRPPLTTIEPDLGVLGKVAADHLLSALGGQRHQGRHTVPVRLVVRASG